MSPFAEAISWRNSEIVPSAISACIVMGIRSRRQPSCRRNARLVAAAIGSSREPLWWTFFLLSGFLGNASLRLSLRARTLPDLILAGSVSAAGDAVDIMSTAIALVLVTQIFRMQMARRAADAFA
jgi:hypothetical protein